MFELILFLLIITVIYYMIDRARRGIEVPKVRKMAALQALREVVGRAAEQNKSIHISTGIGGLSDEWAPMTIAAMAILKRVMEYAGEFGVRVKYYCVRAHMIPAMQDLIQSGYVHGGRPEMYNSEMCEFVGDGQQRAYMAAVMGYISRERPAANIMLGAGFYETYIVLGAGAVAGCLQVAGTPRLYYCATIVALSDYPLIGQELYAAAADITGNPPDLGSLAGQDYGIIICLILMVVTALLATAGTTLWQQLLAW